MPRLNRKGRRRTELGWEELFALRSGLTRDPDRAVRRMTDDEMREYWRVPEIREQVMEASREHCRTSWPTRPAAWWRLDAGEDRPNPVGNAAWSEALLLLKMGVLDADERERLPDLVVKELRVRRGRTRLDPPEWVPELEALARRLGVSDA